MSAQNAMNVYGGMTLKALLENPDLQHAPAVLSSAPGNKSKKMGYGTGEMDFSSAFLGPQLWDKAFNSNADDTDLSLEYMDLDEFLSENGLPVETPNLDELVHSPASPAVDVTLAVPPVSPIIIQQPSSVGQSVSSPPPTMGILPPPSTHITVKPVSPQGVSPTHFLTPAKEAVAAPSKAETRAASPGSLSATGSTPPSSPLSVNVSFKLTEQDLVLSSIPGQELFDPTCTTFSEDDLKPQPMIKKSKKVFVPDEQKDDKYWARRTKNNYAAKRSRDARRVKENQIAMRAGYLEKENGTLREELEKLRRDNCRLKHRLSKYESVSSSSSS